MGPLLVGNHVLRVFASSSGYDEPHPPSVMSWRVEKERAWDQTAVAFEGLAQGWHELFAYATDPLNGTDVVGARHRFYVDRKAPRMQMTPKAQGCYSLTGLEHVDLGYWPPNSIQGMHECLVGCKSQGYSFGGTTCPRLATSIRRGDASAINCKCVDASALEQHHRLPTSECAGGRSSSSCDGDAAQGTFTMGGHGCVSLYHVDEATLVNNTVTSSRSFALHVGCFDDNTFRPCKAVEWSVSSAGDDDSPRWSKHGVVSGASVVVPETFRDDASRWYHDKVDSNFIGPSVYRPYASYPLLWFSYQQYSRQPPFGEKDGVKRIQLRGIDAVGNVERSPYGVDLFVTVDTTPPSVRVAPTYDIFPTRRWSAIRKEGRRHSPHRCQRYHVHHLLVRRGRSPNCGRLQSGQLHDPLLRPRRCAHRHRAHHRYGQPDDHRRAQLSWSTACHPSLN